MIKKKVIYIASNVLLLTWFNLSLFCWEIKRNPFMTWCGMEGLPPSQPQISRWGGVFLLINPAWSSFKTSPSVRAKQDVPFNNVIRGCTLGFLPTLFPKALDRAQTSACLWKRISRGFLCSEYKFFMSLTQSGVYCSLARSHAALGIVHWKGWEVREHLTL